MSSAALDRTRHAAPDTPDGGSSPAPTVTLFDALEAAEPFWRKLEAEAVLTPYQRYDWIAPLWRTRARTGVRCAVVVIAAAGVPVALLPLEIAPYLGIRRATLIGADIGNSDWMIVAPGSAPLLTRARLEPLLGDVAKAAGGIDLISLYNQPLTWQGTDNPLLAFPHQPAPDNLYLGALGTNGSFNRFDDKRLGNLLKRRRKLAEMRGEVVLKAATSPDEIDRVHAIFLEQRGARFAQMGIANVFAEPEFVTFFREGAIASLGTARPALIFHALHAGDEIVATSLGSFAGNHFSQYINATSGDPEIAKFRLIGLLMHELFADVAARGGTSIDMGLGDFDYKEDWTVATTTYDGQIPLTLAGRVAGTAILSARRVKRAIKQHDQLWDLVRKLRAKLGRGRPA
jgi:CelD/BcsL family acetyltransferase involved in cellulose biosynthesis